MFATSHNNVHGIWRNNDWIILLNMFKMFPWKWIKRIYLEDNAILVNFDNWIYFQIFHKAVLEVLSERCLLPDDTYAAEKRKEMFQYSEFFFLKFVSEFDVISSYLL